MNSVRISSEWRMPDEVWERLEPLLPKWHPSPEGGRPALPLRQVADGIYYVLRTGCQWKAAPREFGSGSALHHYYQEWVRRGVFRKLWQMALHEYDKLKGIEWEWQCIDGAITKAPLGGEKTGKNPTDRGKSGTKRSLLTDGAGVPLGLEVSGANRHDVQLIKQTIKSIPIRRPKPTRRAQQHLCADKAYDSDEVRRLVKHWGYTAHIKARGDEEHERKQVPGYRARRWVVERTHSWFNRFRRLLIRWEKKVPNYLAFLHVACAWFTLRAAEVFG